MTHAKTLHSCDASWSAMTRLSGKDAWGSPGGTHPIWIDGDTVHVVFAQAGTIWHRVSHDAGLAWSPMRPLTEGGNAQYPCSLEATAAHLHLVWPEDRDGTWELWHRRSCDGGCTWGPAAQFTRDADMFRAGTAACGSALYVAWTGKQSVERTPVGTHTWGEVLYVRSPDAGLSWEPVQCLSLAGASAIRPAVAVCGEFVHVAWADRCGAHGLLDWDIYYRRSADGGATWEAPVRFSHTPTHARHPQIIAAPEGRVCCVWEDGSFYDGELWRGDAALYSCDSSDDGATWSLPRRITSIGAPHGRATHAKSFGHGARIHLAWTESPFAYEGATRVSTAHCMSSCDGGMTWSAPTQIAAEENCSLLTSSIGGTDSYIILLIRDVDRSAIYCCSKSVDDPHGPRLQGDTAQQRIPQHSGR